MVARKAEAQIWRDKEKGKERKERCSIATFLKLAFCVRHTSNIVIGLLAGKSRGRSEMGFP